MLIKAIDLLQQEDVDVAEVSKAVKAFLHLLGGANADETLVAHLTKEKFPKDKRNLFGEGFEAVVKGEPKPLQH